MLFSRDGHYPAKLTCCKYRAEEVVRKQLAVGRNVCVGKVDGTMAVCTHTVLWGFSGILCSPSFTWTLGGWRVISLCLSLFCLPHPVPHVLWCGGGRALPFANTHISAAFPTSYRSCSRGNAPPFLTCEHSWGDTKGTCARGGELLMLCLCWTSPYNQEK